MIDISGCSLDGTIILTVWDNGEGISPETLEVLENDINEKNCRIRKKILILVYGTVISV